MDQLVQVCHDTVCHLCRYSFTAQCCVVGACCCWRLTMWLSMVERLMLSVNPVSSCHLSLTNCTCVVLNTLVCVECHHSEISRPIWLKLSSIGLQTVVKCLTWLMQVRRLCNLLISWQPGPTWAWARCRISPHHFLAEFHVRRLNQASYVLLCFVLFAFSGLSSFCDLFVLDLSFSHIFQRISTWMALYSLFCADVPLRICSLSDLTLCIISSFSTLILLVGSFAL